MLIAVNPKLPMRNKNVTRDFYLNKLGFKNFGSADYDGYLMVQKDQIQIHFFEFKGLDPKENYGQIYIRTDYIDELYQSFLDSKISIHPNGQLETKPWGQKEFSILDPDNNLLTFGQSTIQDENRELVEQQEPTEVNQTKIKKGQLSDLKALFQIYSKAKDELDRNGIYQWTDTYPTISIIESDLKKGVLYTLKNGHEIIGAININEEQEAEYQSVDWKFDNSKVLVIHRLVVDPKHQRKGHAQRLMDFAEDFASNNNYSSIRLDAYSQNNKVIEFYKKRNYFIRGDVFFPYREYSFHCMEKEISPAT